MAEYILRLFGPDAEPFALQTDSEETLTDVLFHVARVAEQGVEYDPTRVLTRAIALAMAQEVSEKAEAADGEQAHG